MIQSYLQQYPAIQAPQITISKTARALGISWKRAKLRVYSPNPLYQVKRQ